MKGSEHLMDAYQACGLCPRDCGVDRRHGIPGRRLGQCGQTDRLRIAYVGPHFGEEPPISGVLGSGTIFFCGCSLKCAFCQNHQISHEGIGKDTTLEELYETAEQMIRSQGVHNINFVTPDHFLPHVFQLVEHLRTGGYNGPFVYNLSGYQDVEVLKRSEPFADIFLPDFKYSDPLLSARLSKCKAYPKAALEAIAEMIRQKGFLDALPGDSALASKGVLVRHLILPGEPNNSTDALTSLFLEFGPELPLSLMSQYQPVIPQPDPHFNRPISKGEFEEVYSHALSLGFENIFVQFPDKQGMERANASPFLPDFRKAHPFG